ncbi:hypothetical protein [Streptomyces sp. BE303]|uniref:hypothetical protein n=1 Tax=Streptomyces sp. BE303 TaxID=3002528 RepID=UPI002E763C9E|nr:hypothetical protein [Streptomyces sp. BE303]MED7948541.1 hypothetical protein [Streptomyces sp. BE303]
MTGTRLARTTPTTARTRTRAGAGLLLAGALLTGCGAQPGDIPLSEIRAESPSPTPTPTPEPAAAAPGVVGAAAATPPSARNGLIASRVTLGADRETGAILSTGPDGTGERPLTQPPDGARDDNPSWSPDGVALAFDRTGDAASAARIWLTTASGENAHQVGPLCSVGAPDCINEAESHPAFSPDGGRIAFNRTWGSGDPETGQIQYSDLYLMTPDGTDVQRLTFLTNDKPYSGEVTSPSWSPDGKQLVFEYRTSATGLPADGRALFSVAADGTGLRQLTPWELRAGGRAGWSPDGTRIVFTTFPAGPDLTPGGGIYAMHADGSAIEALTPGPSDVSYGPAAYAPDGGSIVFARAAGTGTSSDLYVMQPDGGSPTRLTDTPDRSESRPSWGTAPPQG